MDTNIPFTQVSDQTLRLYAIVRDDIYMPAGKAIAQAAHGFLDSFLECQSQFPEIANTYREDGHGTKVTLKANLYKILKAQDDCLAAQIPCALVTDSGHICPPDFDGSPIITALGIGPATRDQVKHITKKFKLY